MKNFLFILVFTLCGVVGAWGQCNPRPDAKFDIGSNDVCEGIPITFTNTTITHNNSLHYTWDWGDGSPLEANNSTTVTHIFNLTTTQACGDRAFDVRLDALNNNTSCLSHYIIKPVYVNKQPVAAFSAPIVCFPNSTPFTNQTCPSNPTHTPTYSWSFGEQSSGTNNISALENPSHTYAAPGTYTVALTVSGLGCGTSTATHQIQVLEPPVAHAAYTLNPNTGCIPLNVNFNNTSTPANNTHTWVSSPVIAFLPLSSVANPTAIIVSAGTYTVTLTEANACGTSSTTTTIVAIEKPSFTLNPIPHFCTSTNNAALGGYISNLTMGGMTSVNYNWSVTGSATLTNANTANPTINAGPGTYTVTAAVSNTCGTVTHTQTIVVDSQGGLSIALPAAVPCIGGQPIQLTANTTGGTWGGCANAQGQVPANAGNNGCNVTYSVSTGACSGSTSITVVINPPPVPSASAPPVCVGSALNLSGGGGGSYAWAGPNGYTSASQNPSLPNATQSLAGVYTVTVTSAQGCTATATTNAVINVIPVITTTSPVSACSTASAFPLQATANPTGTIVWSGGNVTSSGIFNAQAAGTGSHTVTATVTVNGCSSSNQVTVNVTANAVANAGTDQTVCPQASVINLDTQAGVTGGGVWTISPSTPALSGSIFTPSMATAGSSYTLTLTLNGNDPNCITTDTKTITIRSLPQGTVSAPAVCENSALNLGVNPAFTTYVWAGPNSFTSTQQNPILPNATGAMTGTYTVTITDGNGCTNTATINTTVNSLPNLTLTPLSICQNTIPFGLTATAPTTGSFVWSGAGVTSPNFDASQTVGIYTVSCTVTDANGCTKSGTTTVEITLNPQPSITAVSPLCANAAEIQLVGTPSGGVWSGNGVNGTRFTAANAQIGNNTITYTTGNGNATCTKTATTVINIRALPTVTATAPPVCLNGTLNLNATGTGVSFAWADANGYTSASQNPSRTNATLAMSGTYTVTTTDVNSCTNSATVTATVNALPVLTFPILSICKNTNPYALTATATGASPFVYVWSGTGVTNPNFDANQAVGSYTVSCTVTDVNTCSTSGTATVTITANPDPIIAAVSPICANAAAIQLVGTPSGGVWSGAGTTGTTDATFTPSVGIIGNNTITYTVNPSDNVCKKIITTVIDVLPLPQIVAQDTAACIGTILKLFATTSNAATVPMGTYAWTGANFASALQNPTVTTSAIAANGGIYTVIATSTNTCTNSATVLATINLLPVVTAVPMTICQNTVQLFDMTTGLPNSGGTGVYTAGATGVAVTAPNKFDASQAIGLYPIIYTFTDVHGCKDTAHTTVEITSNNVPILTAIPSPCLNDTIINLIPHSDRTGGEWTGVGVDTNLSSFNPTTAGVGTHTLTYTVAPNDPVCKKSTTIDVVVKPLPNLSLTSNSPCAEGILQFTLTITGAPAGSTYNWAGVNGFTSTLQNPTIPNVTSNAIGIYTVTVTGDNGCKDTAMNTTIVYGLPNTRSNDTTYCRTAGCYNLPFVSISDPAGTFVWNSWNAAAQSAINTGATPPCFSSLISGNSGAGQAFPAVVTLTDTHGCIGRDTVNITVNEPAHLALSPMIDTVCSGTNVVLHALPAGGHWYRTNIGFPDPSITQDSIVNTASLIGGGNFTYTYSYGEGSCHVKDSVRIFVIALDTISAGGNDSFCINRAPFQLVGQTPRNYTPATAHWENAHTNSAGVYIQNQGITSTGFYTPYIVAGADSSEVIIDTVKFVYTDPVRHCQVVRTKIITIHPLPVPANAIPDVGCINTNIAFVNNSPNIAVSHWEFSKPQGTVLFVVDSTDVNHTFQDTGVYYVRLEVTSAFGCKAAIVDSIHIVAPPFIAFAMSADTICTGLPVTMLNSSGGYQVNYIWNYGDGTRQDSVFAPLPHRFAQAECDTVYYVTLTAYNLCKTLTMRDSILIHPLPVPRWERSQDTICSGQLVSFINHTKSCNTKRYDWTIDGVAWTTDSIPPAMRFTADSIARTYTICLHATGICGDSTVCKTIYVLPSIITAFFNQNRDRGCRPLTVNFAQSSGGTTAPLFTYFWDFGDGFTSTQANPTHVFDSPTRDTFRVLLLVSDGCFADTVSSMIYTFPQPRLSFTHPPYQCAEQGMTFTNTSLDPISSVWYFDDGASSSNTNSIHAFAQAGYHTVTLIGKSLTNGCPDTTMQQVLIRENPLITPTVTPSDGCGPLLVTFTTAGAPASFDYYYTWNFGDGGTAVDTAHVAIAQSVQHLYAKRDSITRFHVGLTVIDQYQCKSDTLYSPIVLYPTPTADFAYTLDPSCGVNTVASFINASTSTAGNLRYTWDFGDYTVGSHDDSPTHQYLSSSGKTVTLTAENTYNCADSVQHRLEYCDGLYIPSAFSPETGLGEVRLFGAKGLGIKQYRLAVYSRFGNLIWETDKLEQGLPVERWDGKFNGQLVPQDMYIWKCEAVFENGNIWQGQEDASHKLQRVGTVTVLR